MNFTPSWICPTKSTTPDSMVIVSRSENIDFWGFQEPLIFLIMGGGFPHPPWGHFLKWLPVFWNSLEP